VQEYSENFQAEVILSLQTLIRKSNEHDKRFDIIDERFAIKASSYASSMADLLMLPRK